MPDDTQPAKWQLSDIHHIGLTVSDLERSIQFYRDVLGMTLIRRRPGVREDYISRSIYQTYEQRNESLQLD